MTERKTEMDVAIEIAATEIAMALGCMGNKSDMEWTMHKYIDPIVTLPEEVELPVEVITLELDDPIGIVSNLSMGLQDAADFINRVAKEKG